MTHKLDLIKDLRKVQEAHDLYQQGKSYSEVSVLIGISASHIARMFIHYKLPVRTRHETKLLKSAYSAEQLLVICLLRLNGNTYETISEKFTKIYYYRPPQTIYNICRKHGFITEYEFIDEYEYE